MKKLIGSLLIISILISCNGKKNGNMVVHGTIDGLKKGTVYLEKLKDTTLVSVDSVSLNGTNTFTLTDNVESPEVYNLILSEKPDETISFFGEKGEITINTKLSKFAVGAIIKGSKNQELLEEHKAMLRKFSDKQLDLIKEKFDAKKNNDSELLAKIEKEENNLVKRKYLYTTNFAIQHGKFEVALYIALTDLYYANVKLLDTVNKSLSKKVKKSKYGLDLKKFIKNIKKNEK
jgi:hypothetical protein